MQRLCAAYEPPLCRLCNGSLKRQYKAIAYTGHNRVKCQGLVKGTAFLIFQGYVVLKITLPGNGVYEE
jgi:hypothetical protein